MAWTTGYTFVVGYVLASAKMNEQVSANATYVHDRNLANAYTDSTPVTMTTQNTYYTGASVSLAAGTWLIWWACKITPANVDDRIIFRIRNNTAGTTLATLSGGSDEGRSTGQVVVTATLSSTSTIQGQATNESSNGGTLAQASLLQLRVDM